MASTQKSSAQVADADGYEQALAEYQTELAHYLRERIQPGLNAGAIAVLARSIARDIAAPDPPQAAAATDRDAPSEDAAHGQGLEAHMHDLQAELGPDWILRVSVHGPDAWLTAEKADASQHVEASDAKGLVRIVQAINENVAR